MKLPKPLEQKDCQHMVSHQNCVKNSKFPIWDWRGYLRPNKNKREYILNCIPQKQEPILFQGTKDTLVVGSGFGRSQGPLSDLGQWGVGGVLIHSLGQGWKASPLDIIPEPRSMFLPPNLYRELFIPLSIMQLGWIVLLFVSKEKGGCTIDRTMPVFWFPRTSHHDWFTGTVKGQPLDYGM